MTHAHRNLSEEILLGRPHQDAASTYGQCTSRRCKSRVVGKVGSATAIGSGADEAVTEGADKEDEHVVGGGEDKAVSLCR